MVQIVNGAKNAPSRIPLLFRVTSAAADVAVYYKKEHRKAVLLVGCA